jgi:outer membrane protein
MAAMRIQSARYGASIAAHLPLLGINAQRNIRQTEGFNVSGRPELRTQGDNDHLKKAGLVLSMPLFSSGALLAGTRAAQQAAQAAAWDVQEQTDGLIMDTLKAYYELYLAQSLVAVYESGRALSLESTRVAQQREQGGVSSRAEVFQATAALARADIEYIRALEDAEAKRVILASALAVPPEQLARLRIDHEQIKVFMPVGSRHSESGLDLTYQRPLYASALAKVEAARHRLEQVTREGRPSVSLAASLSQQNQSNRGIAVQSGLERTLGLTMNIPIFEGFSRTYKVIEAQSQMDAVSQESEDIRIRIDSEITQNRILLRQEINILKNASEYQRVAMASQQSAMERYKKGLTGLVDLINAQRELISAQSEYLQSSVRILMAQLRVIRDEGKLYQELGFLTDSEKF